MWVLCVTPTNPPQQNQTKQTPVIGAGRHNCSASRVRVRINSSDNKTGAAAKVAGKVAVLACRMGGERTGFWGGDPPSVCSRASLRERNGHLHNKSPASFHTAGRIEGRALSLLSFLGGKGRTKPKVRSTNRKTKHPYKQKQVVTHLTSRHAEKKKNGAVLGRAFWSCPLVATLNKDHRCRSPSALLSLGGGRLSSVRSAGRGVVSFSSLWVFGLSPENNIFLRRGGQAHCGRAVFPLCCGARAEAKQNLFL